MLAPAIGSLAVSTTKDVTGEALSTTPSKRYRVVDGACGSKFRIQARKRLPGTDRFGPVDCRIRANPARPLSYRHIADSDSRVLDMETIKQLQRFYVAEVFRLQPLIPGSQPPGREQLSAACAGRNLQTQIRKALSNGFTGDNSHGGKDGSEENEDIKRQISTPGVAVSMPGVAGRFGSQSESLRRPRASQR